MQMNDRVALVPGSEWGSANYRTPRAPAATVALGRVIAVSGSQVLVEFTADVSSLGDGTDVTVGTFLGIEIGGALAIGALCDISREHGGTAERPAHVSGRIDLLGEIVTDAAGTKSFQRGITLYPKLGSAIVSVGSDDLQVVFDLANPHTIEVGRLQQNVAIPAYVNVEEIVRKHFAIVGSTGAGKSTALALIVRKIMAARGELRVLVIDTHNEYGECFDEWAQVFGPANLRLPFWLFNFDEITQLIFGSRAKVEQEVMLLAELIPLAKAEYARSTGTQRPSFRLSEPDGTGFTVDTPVPYRIDTLVALAETRIGKLENSALAVHYQRLLLRINTARRNPRYSFMFAEPNDDDGGDPMLDILCELLRLTTEGQPMAVVQLAGFPAETMEVIVSVLFRLAFEFGVWSDGRLPMLIICEEAHNYANADRTLGFRSARDGLSRIAKEGRKHGVFLGLITQRPHQLDSTLISQCSTVFAMRLGHDDDQKIVRAAVSDSASRLLTFLPSLGTREALVIGAGVPTVMRLRFEELPPQFIPKSQAVWGGDLDAVQKVDQKMVASVIARWRGTARANPPAPQLAKPAAARGSNEPLSWSLPT
jgi:hypothetical protein